MGVNWLSFKVDEICEHPSDIYHGCPLRRIEELEADNKRLRDERDYLAKALERALEGKL